VINSGRKKESGKAIEMGRRKKDYVQLCLDLGLPKETRKPVPRNVYFKDYGIDADRKRELKAMCRKEEYAAMTLCAAREANEFLSAYIYLSMTKKVSYDAMCESRRARHGLDYPPCCRNDFYAWQRLAYHIFNEKVKETEHGNSNLET
jgi:hypothetical protein